MVTAEDKISANDEIHQHVQLNEEEGEAGQGEQYEIQEMNDEEIEEIQNAYHNPNNFDDSDDESENEIEAATQANGWVTFTNDTEFSSLNAENEEEAESEEKEAEKEDFTTTGFLKKKFTQEHIDLIKECMKSVKLANVPEWVNRIGPNNPQIAALKREVNPQPFSNVEFPEK